MTYFKSIQLFVLTTMLIVFTVIIINFLIDPFQQYRKAMFHKTIFMKNFYLNAGLIKNYNYDSVVIGSSMTQNFIIDDMKKELGFSAPIKLPIGGGNIVEYNTVLKSTIATKKVKNVLFGLDIFALKNGDNRLPMYLYDNDIFNDYKYLFSVDTFKRSLTYPFLHYTLDSSHPRLDYNLMYQWQHNFSQNDFSKSKVIDNFNKNKINLDNDINQNEILTERFDNFNKYIVSIIKKNPDIDFIFFYPPYSILAYKSMSSGALNTFLETKTMINSQLLKFSNVKVFDFQEELDVISNLDNYKDITHYHQKINQWMLQQIKVNKYKIKAVSSNEDFRSKILNYKIK